MATQSSSERNSFRLQVLFQLGHGGKLHNLLRIKPDAVNCLHGHDGLQVADRIPSLDVARCWVRGSFLLKVFKALTLSTWLLLIPELARGQDVRELATEDEKDTVLLFARASQAVVNGNA